MTTFDLISDLHLDSWPEGINLIDPSAMRNEGSDVLVIAGDTSNYIPQAVEFWKKCGCYEHVIVLDGNHEHYYANAELGIRGYDTHVPGTMAVLQKLAQDNGIHFLNGRNEVLVNGTAFVGINGWYDWNYMPEVFDSDQLKDAWFNYMNDSRMIDFPTGGPRGYSEMQANTLKNKVRFLQDREDVVDIVVVTHTAPRADLLPYTDDPVFNRLNGSFCNTKLQEVPSVDTNHKIRIWCYGHTHFWKDTTIEGIRFVNNCLGYSHEQTSKPWHFQQIHT